MLALWARCLTRFFKYSVSEQVVGTWLMYLPRAMGEKNQEEKVFFLCIHGYILKFVILLSMIVQ